VIVNVSEFVVWSGSVPTILTLYVPIGLKLDTKIDPLNGLTPIRSLAWLRVFPLELLYPVYVQELAYDPQFTVAENGVIAKF
jgi:hypothetical protein